MSEPTTKRLGEQLVQQGVLTNSQLEIALEQQREVDRPLGELLVELGFARQHHVARVMAQQLGLRFARAEDVKPDRTLVAALDEWMVRATRALPVERTSQGLRVLMVDPTDSSKLATLRQFFHCDIQVEMVTEEDFGKLVRECFYVLTKEGRSRDVQTADVGERPVEQVTESLLIGGILRGATDIHFHPEESITRVRCRLDGVLRQTDVLPKKQSSAVTSRLKIMAQLDISEKRMPQDGRMSVDVDGRRVDLRVSTMPCAFGESVVLRVLDRSSGNLPVTELGLCERDASALRAIAARPHGLFLVTGPTGSGKTTTLYSVLGNVDSLQRNVATIEDPIESNLPFVRQSQAKPSIGFTFGLGLRSLLRQDPDVILVGEIRDQETADMAIKSAMTGHLVFSTLHTNTAVGAVSRLTDMGIAPYLVEEAVIGVLGQRLVRTLCRSCATWEEPTEHERAWLGPHIKSVPRAAGCERCAESGYSGRTLIAELFQPDESSAQLIREGEHATRIRAAALLGGYIEIVEDGLTKVLEGITSVSEVMRFGRRSDVAIAGDLQRAKEGRGAA